MTNCNSNSIPSLDLNTELRITEVFYSLQGEADTSGAPTVFIRLTGCPLRCVYCDTTYSFYGGQTWSFDKILTELQNYPCKRICVTGGEPLAQKKCIDLLHLLISKGYQVSLETAGALSVAKVPNEVSKVMDLKTPSSKEEHRNLWENVSYLTLKDQVKIVIMNQNDYTWSKIMVDKFDLAAKVNTVWFSPMFSVEETGSGTAGIPELARNLAEWILADGLEVKMQLQLHKLIWSDAKGK